MLYLDQDRLDRYASQLNPSGAKIDKTKKLGWEISITGLKASVGQEERPRPWTQFEKMEAILQQLRETGDLRDARPRDDHDGPAFVHEACVATKVLVPHAATPGDLKKCKNSASGFRQGWALRTPLCSVLIEDYRSKDDRPVSFRGASTYTLLQSLVHYTRSLQLKTFLDNYVPDDPHPNPYARFDNKPESLRQYHNVKNYCYEFATNPTALLERWGCLIAAPRRIQSLYFIREWGRDAANSWTVPSVFAYAIWITAADGTETSL